MPQRGRRCAGRAWPGRAWPIAASIKTVFFPRTCACVRARGRAYSRGLRRPFGALAPLRHRAYPTAPNRCAVLNSEINFAWNTNTKTPARLRRPGDLSDLRERGRERRERLTLGAALQRPGVSPLRAGDHRSVGRSLRGGACSKQRSRRVHELAARPSPGHVSRLSGWPAGRILALSQSLSVAEPGIFGGDKSVKRTPKNRRASHARGEIKSRHGAG